MYIEQDGPEFLWGQRDAYRVTPTILGKGSIGTTYEAIPKRHPNLIVAAKILKPDPPENIKQQAFQEAEVTRRLQGNDHIIPLYDLPSSQSEDIFLILEKAKFGSAHRFLFDKYPLTPQLILKITNQLTEALIYADSHNIVHRDVNPNNFLLTGEEENTPYVYLADFSLAVTGSRENPYINSLTAGSFPYMSPDQFYGNVTPSADQYSLGVCVYEWLSGELPFYVEGDQLDSVVGYSYASKHIHETPPSIRQNSRKPFTDKDDLFTRESMMEVVTIALAKKPYERFEDVYTFGEELQRAYDESLPQRRTFVP